MSIISSAQPPSQFSNMLDLLADPKKTKESLDQFEKTRNEAESARRQAEETLACLRTKEEAISQREAMVAKREAVVESAQKSLEIRAEENAKKYQVAQAELEIVRTRTVQESEESKKVLLAREQTVQQREYDLASALAMVDSRQKDLQAREQSVLSDSKANCQLRERLNARLLEFQKLQQV